MFHIVTLFPVLLNYTFYAPLLLRIVLGIFALSFAFQFRHMINNTSHESNEDTAPSSPSPYSNEINYFVRGLFGICGVLVIAGLFTQVATIILSLLFVIGLAKPKWIFAGPMTRTELILLLAISVSLMVLPAGYFAIDYPL